jgi:hypothetical protein
MSIVDDLNSEAALRITNDLDFLDGFASRPLPDLRNAIAHQVGAANGRSISQEYHARSSISPSRLVKLTYRLRQPRRLACKPGLLPRNRE